MRLRPTKPGVASSNLASRANDSPEAAPPENQLGPRSTACGFPGCGSCPVARGLCNGHWKQQREGRELRPLGYARGPRQPVPGDVRGTLKIQLDRGLFAVIDEADLGLVGDVRWSYRDGYAVRNASLGDRRYELVRMHRLLWRGWGNGEPETIDHVNGDGLDNRRSNLRAATRTENNRNARLSALNQAGFKGVNRASNGRFRARIRVDGKAINLGYFDTGEEAHAAYVAAAREHFGEFARAS